mmetsp:Transcript_82439/g.133709  ORF Transcript_82439/g.133709 Transcript_82439/m.133709 type:complete len:267 (-) Transcript_82439:247-1047(-)
MSGSHGTSFKNRLSGIFQPRDPTSGICIISAVSASRPHALNITIRASLSWSSDVTLREFGQLITTSSADSSSVPKKPVLIIVARSFRPSDVIDRICAWGIRKEPFIQAFAFAAMAEMLSDHVMTITPNASPSLSFRMATTGASTSCNDLPDFIDWCCNFSLSVRILLLEPCMARNLRRMSGTSAPCCVTCCPAAAFCLAYSSTNRDSRRSCPDTKLPVSARLLASAAAAASADSRALSSRASRSSRIFRRASGSSIEDFFWRICEF